MKRYNIEPTIGLEVLSGGDVRGIESPDGDWVKWGDVQRLLNELVKCGQTLEIIHIPGDEGINKIVGEQYESVRKTLIEFGEDDLNNID